MKIIYRSRGQGRTETLVKWVKDGRHTDPDGTADNHRAIIVLNHDTADRLKRRYSLDMYEIYTHMNFQNAAGYALVRGRQLKEVIIDDADMFLQHYFQMIKVYGIAIEKD